MTNAEAMDEIEHIRQHGVGLTEWEADFLQDLAEKLERYGNDPSPKQAAMIDKIARERLP